MRKKLNLGLNAFDPVPTALRAANHPNTPVGEVEVDLTVLFHHLFLDTWGYEPPDPNPIGGLYLPMLAPGDRLRFRGSRLGSHKEARVGECNKFGKAFCRWFLSVHCGINYFAHLDQVLDGILDARFGPLSVVRTAAGDAPDYLCAPDSWMVHLAEAKGTAYSISFNSAKFADWREQFNRVRCQRQDGTEISVKGFVVATRLADEDHPRVDSLLLAEDPNTAGKSLGNSEEFADLARATICGHYADVLDKLRLPLLAAALRQELTLPDKPLVRVGLWECQVPPARGVQFVGGYFPLAGERCPAPFPWPEPWPEPGDLPPRNLRLCLSAGEWTFFGLEMGVFRQLRKVTSIGRHGITSVQPFEPKGHSTPDLSVLRDGTALGSLDFFHFVRVEGL